MLPLLPHGRADDRRDGVGAHDEERADQKAGREGRSRAGEVRRKLVRCGRIGTDPFTTILTSNQSLQRNRFECYVRLQNYVDSEYKLNSNFDESWNI